MSKVKGSKILLDYEEQTVKQLTPEIYVVVERDGDDAYRNTYDSTEDAVDAHNHEGTLVATYRLVAVEELALVRSTKIVEVTIPADVE